MVLCTISKIKSFLFISDHRKNGAFFVVGHGPTHLACSATDHVTDAQSANVIKIKRIALVGHIPIRHTTCKQTLFAWRETYLNLCKCGVHRGPWKTSLFTNNNVCIPRTLQKIISQHYGITSFLCSDTFYYCWFFLYWKQRSHWQAQCPADINRIANIISYLCGLGFCQHQYLLSHF